MASNFTQKIMATLHYALPENSSENIFILANVIGSETGIGTIGGSVKAEQAYGSDPDTLQITFPNKLRNQKRAAEVLERIGTWTTRFGLSLMNGNVIPAKDNNLIHQS